MAISVIIGVSGRQNPRPVIIVFSTACNTGNCSDAQCQLVPDLILFIKRSRVTSSGLGQSSNYSTPTHLLSENHCGKEVPAQHGARGRRPEVTAEKVYRALGSLSFSVATMGPGQFFAHSRPSANTR